ncbi:MAG: glycosyltransferase family 2 protein [Elusimicrobia bacterium]|nr:glycosyltransferase family 2 protein [Elusimicrobiota bacterium]
MPCFSVVIPVFNEQENIAELYGRVSAALKNFGGDDEVIFVDDGSTDGTRRMLDDLHRSNQGRVKVIGLSRNFGHQAAITAGLKMASGDAVVTMDGDLQHPPEAIGQFVAKWNEGYEVVTGVRQNTQGQGFWKEINGRAAYWLISCLGGIHLPFGAADFRLIDRKVLEYIQRLEERHLFLRGLIPWLGFKQTTLEYTVAPRRHGRPKYTLARQINLALDGLISFSIYPLRLAIILGLAISAAGFCYACYALYTHFFSGRTVTGWTSLLVGVLLMGGVQLIVLGIMGEYLGRVYEEVKRRPSYVVERLLGFKSGGANS